MYMCWYDSNLMFQWSSSFFYSQLMQNGIFTYGNVQKWMSKIDIFKLVRLCIPIHNNNNHWIALIVFLGHEGISIVCYDSLCGDNMRVMNNIEQYLLCEWKAREGRTENTFPKCTKTKGVLHIL